ncbi:2-succinyl-6-hydroxy-2,4-cyclohexadiene-1-carboxylate synthase [Streptomyces antimycoticus]
MTVPCRPPSTSGLPPALFVHGLGGSSQNWSALMELLAERVEGEALDLPGFGDSPPPDDGNYSITGHARAVIRYLDAQDRGPVHLVGNSMGGAITTRDAAPGRSRFAPSLLSRPRCPSCARSARRCRPACSRCPG